MKFTKETFKRALRTFIQAFVACLVVGLPTIDFNVEKEAVKAALIGLAVSSISAALSAVMNLEKKEQLGGASLSFSQWIDKYIGKKTDYDGVYGVQCVDLIDCYIDACLGLKKGFWGNAKEWWQKRSTSKWLKDNFDFILPSYKNGELKPGDIGIRTSGAWGHIFVVADTTANGKIKYYDQNADGKGAAMSLREKPYTDEYINGVLRPKNQKALGIPAIPTAPSYKEGETYTLNAHIVVRTAAGTGNRIKKVKELTADGKKNCTSKDLSADAVLKKGTKVTVKKVIKKGNDIWLKIPSGCIAAYYKGEQYVK